MLFFIFVDFFGVVNLLCDKFEFHPGICPDGAVKAGLIADVALAGVDGHFQNQAILVAIDEYLFDFLAVAAFFAFFP